MVVLRKNYVNLNKKVDINFILLFFLKMDVFFFFLMKIVDVLYGDNLC